MSLALTFGKIGSCPQIPSRVAALFILMDGRDFYQSSICNSLSGAFYETSPATRFMPYISQVTVDPEWPENTPKTTIGKYNVHNNVIAVVMPSGTFVGPYSPIVTQELDDAGFKRAEGIGVPHIYNRDMWPPNVKGYDNFYLVGLLFEACRRFEDECRRRRDGAELPAAHL